jgi:uncharacterized OsmC-like protein
VDIETGNASPLGPVSVLLQFRGHKLVQDKPAASGGQDEGPMASEFLLGALLACQHSTFVKVAAKRKLDAHIVSLDGAMEFTNGDISALRVTFQVKASPLVEDKAIETAMRLTDTTCTISRALKIPVQQTLVRA